MLVTTFLCGQKIQWESMRTETIWLSIFIKIPFLCVSQKIRQSHTCSEQHEKKQWQHFNFWVDCPFKSYSLWLLIYSSSLRLSFLTGDSTLEFEVEVISLSQQTSWQKLVNDILPLLCLALVPTLLGLVGLYLYNKAHAQPHGKKKSKDKKSKKK